MSVGLHGLGPRTRCSRCTQNLNNDPFPFLILLAFDPKGWETESERKSPLLCTDCQLTTHAGALDLLLAVEFMPDNMFDEDIIIDMIDELSTAKNLVLDYTTDSIPQHLVTILYRFRGVLDLEKMFFYLRILVSERFSASIMARLSGHALVRMHETMRERHPTEARSYSFVTLANEGMEIGDARELESYLKQLDDLVTLADYGAALGIQNVDIGGGDGHDEIDDAMSLLSIGSSSSD